MTVTFITGANKSLGYESARRLIGLGHTVLIGARDPERGRTAADALGARFVQIDVTDDESVAAAAADVAAHEGHVDVLINNAGVPGAHGPAADLTAADAAYVFDTNVIGIVRVTHAFLPLLKTSENPVIVNVSSGLGSFGVTHDPDRVESTLPLPLYTSSKAAVTMLTTQYAKALPELRVNVVDPGWTATDFNNHSGPQTLEEGTDAIVALATIGPDGPTGTFQDRSGTVPW
ncbi:SDR family NAD(P)-dependent oxidoreductase [Cryptosporangium phraense]|uniref:SDR family NAD(P)-dependent oxidoreductase n=1 Tax=Cryptosporangium phraense TaxID=2593070 RepID=A0A545B252_9ACTN|nr:SDR family NAD(P)-dependent oxidoreductase [Cryptosporangium phraense]TQS46925.1 SDR family NAD(P)-dependent oxidoreductase [Cryptosporangium phraense]